MSSKASLYRLLLMLPVVAAACRPEIGDACDVSADCAESADRICDPTQPGGYCTIFNCEPGGCPDEAICIAFGTNLSAVEGCNDPNGSSRFRRTFCMASCEKQSDCRSGYVCEDLGIPNNEWGATIAETRSVSGRVCVTDFRPAKNENPNTAVCAGPTDAGATTGGQGGAAGAGQGGTSGGGAGGAGGQGGDGGVAGAN